ncbi:hypothetical protein KP509_31G064100 [Ceratopteris richardii]|uniref:NADP-dependent oxidoreductase domain-containing protein n=1 Tax=Ceratopteris richardii TaxID=49495 RepID=A0A8T2R056_CERRI|nr:hypothetical protein KP509_31G064100 [Ceratopteris richardii]
MSAMSFSPTLLVTTASVSPAQASKYVPLGRTSLQVSRIGVGTLQWGDPGSGFGTSYGEPELSIAFQELLKGGINFIDTAEVYGYQGIKNGTSSEQLIGKFAKEHTEGAPIIATKFFTIPWTNFLVGGGLRIGRKSLLDALRASLKRLGRKRVDLYQIHFPFPTLSNAALMESLKEAVELGLTTAVGVSNYSKKQMEEADDLLASYGVPLASNQVCFNLLQRDPDKNGLLTSCKMYHIVSLFIAESSRIVAYKERNISLIAYSPLCSGRLTDKALLKIDSKSAKVALSYLIAKGAIPIPGCKNEYQAKSHCELMDQSLTMEEVQMLEEAASYI